MGSQPRTVFPSRCAHRATVHRLLGAPLGICGGTQARQRALVAQRPTGPADEHCEIQNGVIVGPESALRSQNLCNLTDPSFTPRLGVIVPPGQPCEPAGDVVVDDHCALPAMQRQRGRGSIWSHARQILQLGLGCRGRAATGCDDLRGAVQQWPAPVQAEPRGYLCRVCSRDLRKISRTRKGCAESRELPLSLGSARASQKHFCDQRQPWVALRSPFVMLEVVPPPVQETTAYGSGDSRRNRACSTCGSLSGICTCGLIHLAISRASSSTTGTTTEFPNCL